jgi:DNA-binding CsgD family transcriptional regulator
VLSKSLSPEQLVEALERIRDGEFLVLTGSGKNESGGDWPARTRGLSEREAEIVSLITHGLGNDDIADRLFLSINTVKSYIRSAYRKMGVTTRKPGGAVGSRPRLQEAGFANSGAGAHSVRVDWHGAGAGISPRASVRRKARVREDEPRASQQSAPS